MSVVTDDTRFHFRGAAASPSADYPAAAAPLPRRRLSWSTIGRLAVAAVAVAAAGWYGAERLFWRVSIDGVVNAPLLAIRAPIDGRVTASSLEIGRAAQQGELAFRVEDARVDDQLVNELSAKREGLAARLSVIDEQREKFDAIRRDLEGRVEAHRQASAERLTRMTHEAEAEVRAAKSSVARAELDVRRYRELGDRGVVSPAKREEAEDVVRRAQAEVERSQVAAARLAGERDAAARGVLLRDGQTDAPYSRQRIDELQIRLVELSGERAGLRIQLSEVERRLAVETERANARRAALVAVPSQGAVWMLHAVEGTEVTRGSILAEIADCRRAYVETTLPERGFDKVHAGMEVKVRLGGADQDVTGVVRAVRGAGATDRLERAAQIDRRSTDQMTVVVDLPAGVATAADRSCQIGRTAQVLFPR